MPGSLRCPNCGGLNPPEAEWCGQCLQRFVARTPPPPPPPPGMTDAAATSAAAQTPGPVAAPAPGPVAVQKRGAFTVTEEGIKWTCQRCETENPLEESICSVCGTTFADSMRPPVERPVRDPNTVAMYSLFFPGAGHWYLGMKGSAVARGILSTWVVLVAILAAVGGSVLMAAIFGLAAFVLWVLAAHDGYREARGETSAVILKPRMFVYVVIGLLLLMVTMLVTTSFRVNR